MAARKPLDPSLQRRVLPTADVPQVDTYGQPSTRPWWLTTGLLIAITVTLGVVAVAVVGALAFLAYAQRLNEVQAFVERFERTEVFAGIAAFLTGLWLIVKVNAATVFARRGAVSAGNAEAHAGRVLPQLVAAEVAKLRAEVAERTEVLHHLPVDGAVDAVDVVVARSEPEAAGVPQSYGYPPAEPGPEPEPQRGRYREQTGAMPAVTAQTDPPFAWTQTGPTPVAVEPGATTPMTAFPWDEPSGTR